MIPLITMTSPFDDGLYFWNTWVAEVAVSLNKQANDLTSPATLQTTYSNNFTLPDTTALRSLLQNAEQLDAGGVHPYRLIPCRIIDEGEVIFSGSAALQSFQGGWRVLLSGPARSLIDQLTDLKLIDLDLLRFDHVWNLDACQVYAGKETGILYPLIDYGSIDGGILAQDTITPAVYVSTLLSQMLTQVGYSAAGDWLKEPLLRRMFLPFVGDVPKAHDADWVLARQARVAVEPSDQPIVLRNGHPVDIVLPFSVDNRPLDGFQDSTLDCFKADRYAYVCREAGRFSVQATVNFVGIIRYGAPEVQLQVLRNGQPIGEPAYYSEGGYTDFLDDTTQGKFLSLDVKILCRAGDELTIKLTGSARTNVASYALYFSQELGKMYAAFRPDADIHEGDTWPVSANLPDMTCADLLKAAALMTSSTYDIDDIAKTVELKPLSNIIDRQADAQDLSHCIIENEEPENIPILDGYGQKSYLKYREQSDKNLIGYGDGTILCNSQTQPLEQTLFTLPFSAVVDSTTNIPNFGYTVSVQTRKVSGSGTSIQVQTQQAPPCILLAEPTKMIGVTVNRVNEDLTTIPTVVSLMGCWFNKRPDPVKTTDNNFCLSFDIPAGQQNREQTLVQRYFGGLQRVLRRPRRFTVPAYLRPYEMAQIDLYSPVRLRRVRSGALDINDSYFYLNKIANYQNGLCKLVLVPY